jgi:hypothetical protein
MYPYANILLHPLLHGAVGWWDEVLNLIPLVFGSGLLLYLYASSRKRRGIESQLRDRAGDPAQPPEDSSKP